MDNLDDSENNAKISDSAYSNSCSNSQSRRSHSSKSTHSGSHSSGSSGYGGKPSTSGSSNTQQPEKRIKDKDAKKKKSQVDTLAAKAQVEEECRPPEPVPIFEDPKKEQNNVELSPPAQHSQAEKGVESMDIVATERSSVKDEASPSSMPLSTSLSVNFVTSRPAVTYCSEGFSCVISMHDGVVMYTTSSLTTTLGFPKDMWIGRSFIDFVHPKDRYTFASQITSGFAVPKKENGTQEKGQSPENSVSTMVCRIRRYRGLSGGFGVKERIVTFLPFLLKLTFKNISDDEGKVIYLVIQATPFFSAFKVPNEKVTKAVPFVMRHAANGHIEYIDSESVPYMGYLPQDITDKDALQLYHPGDLGYLRHVYETIVKEGIMPRSKPYRMMTQNGDYLRLESEWSSFINPWSKKLEFVISKHHIVEGPLNPDVFQSPEPEKSLKLSEEEKNKAQGLRDSIIRILNEALTKPAEVAKQQMSKRCQDLATFMESLMEEPPKNEDEFRLEIQEADNSYYERDSVMLGGISPHHDYNDSNSSTETPLSYNQLNYNETLQRYFDSHQSLNYEDYHAATEDVMGMMKVKVPSSCLSPMAPNSGDSGEISSGESSVLVNARSPALPMDDYQPVRLSEALLSKHNAEMEKELMKMHRETRLSKGEREKASNDTRKKKKEHLARCNASFQPTTLGTISVAETVPHGVKRTNQTEMGAPSTHKHHCPSPREPRRKPSTSAPQQQPSSTITTTLAASQWPTPAPMNNMNTFILGVGIPQQMSIINPMMPPQMTAVPAGMFPMYYAPAAPVPSTSAEQNSNNPQPQYQPQAMQCMMYGQAMYGSPFMYSPIAPPVSYPMHHTTMMAQTMQSSTLNPLGLTNSNYEEACNSNLQLRQNKVGSWRVKRADLTVNPNNAQGSGESVSSNNALNRSSYSIPDTRSRESKSRSTRMVTSNETVDRTDGESSYSSFYSSFFNTESGSAEESGGGGDKKSNKNRPSSSKNCRPGVPRHQESIAFMAHRCGKENARRKMEPPWLDQVCVTSELIYKYQVHTKSMDEVLDADKNKIVNIEQPSLVNEQLGQLYLDLQLEGVAARLTLEEGITSSSSSGEETSSIAHKVRAPRKKREYSQLGMIYEEDAPLPPPVEEAAPVPGPSSRPAPAAEEPTPSTSAC